MWVKNILFPVDYFQWLLQFFRMLGLYPPTYSKWSIIYNFFSFPIIALAMFSVILELLHIILNEDIFQRKILSIGVIIMHAAAIIRVANWFRTKEKFEEIISIVQRSSFDFTIFKYNGSRKGTISNSTSLIDDFKTTMLRQTNVICCSIYLVVFTYIFLNLFITYTMNYFKHTYEKFNDAANKTSVYRDFPYPMWFPFDVSVSDGFYLMGFFYQPFAYFSVMTSFWCVEWLVLSCIIQLQNQLKVISFALRKVDKDIPKTVAIDKAIFIKKIRLTKTIEEINEIFRCAELLEQLCNGQLLVQNCLATFLICTLLYATTALNVLEESYISTITGIVLLQPFVQCWICQSFTLEFSNVLKRLYELDWINYPPRLRKFLVITIIRLQKPAGFTLGRWRIIDISFYLQLLKMSYSFYTLISRQDEEDK